MKIRALLVASLFGLAMSGWAFAHHGWSWAEEEQSELQGTIASISMAPPHPSPKVKAADGLWQWIWAIPTRPNVRIQGRLRQGW